MVLMAMSSTLKFHVTVKYESWRFDYLVRQKDGDLGAHKVAHHFSAHFRLVKDPPPTPNCYMVSKSQISMKVYPVFSMFTTNKWLEDKLTQLLCFYWAEARTRRLRSWRRQGAHTTSQWSVGAHTGSRTSSSGGHRFHCPSLGTCKWTLKKLGFQEKLAFFAAYCNWGGFDKTEVCGKMVRNFMGLGSPIFCLTKSSTL